MYMRVNKFLAQSGLDSRRKVEELVLSGKIKVNNQTIKDLSYQIDENKDSVFYLDKKIQYYAKFEYYMLNKPIGYITTLKDELNRKKIMDLFKEDTKHIFPVGRLDYNTEGLIILTNDGDFANNIIHPSKKISKTYEVTINKKLTLTHKKLIESGIKIDGEITLPSKIEKEIYTTKINKVIISIFQGRNRQVRKMFDKLGYSIINLKRIRIGKLALGDLDVGKYKKLSKNDINKVFL